MTEHGSSGRPGRWRSGAQSRQRILDTARSLFRQHGYGGTTVRAVAAAAGVDPAMVFYFFGTKQGLFAAAVDISAELPPAVEEIFAGGLDGIGDRIIRTLVENMDKSDRAPLATLTRSAPTHNQSEALLREFIDREISGRLRALLDTPDAEMRVAMVNVQLLGIAVARYIVRIEPVASSSTGELVARFGALVQHCLTGEPS
ncbi:TetR/AcrR family transcriptional regulator [Kibdelosporangium phytohabitans]|uniref:TetR family transcriptional regulator n=1 Tax=Kibdelosporangium phytohabitans TaxID=860235 RepID=A0A0N9I0P3_9PSEU|nr:TetR family transcriptional regulator [Kibdelosporangium phytohabitans]ALG09234.1 TetR family transcriptional regulator [Kibdelosporangium phytohabitans]MBE1469527.1 AcrR family transcriptional regulator [Kibdelosporangium phytohabitans]